MSIETVLTENREHRRIDRMAQCSADARVQQRLDREPRAHDDYEEGENPVHAASPAKRASIAAWVRMPFS